MHNGVIQQLAPPKEIYRKPVNRFVAGFVGSPAMNFISGELTGGSGAPALKTPDGSEIKLEGYPFTGTPGEGRKVVLGVRPEQVEIGSNGSGSGVLPVQVSLIDPMGADSLLWGIVSGDTVSIRIGPDDEFDIGSVLEARFLPDHASLFDVESGDRL